MNVLRAGILGCGGFAHRHASTLASLPDQVEMVAYCNRSPEKAQAFSEQYSGGKALVFSDHHTMFDRVPLDLLVVCLPPYAHTDEVEVAAAHGTHLLLEKPIALSSEQAWRMVEAAEKAGIQTQVGFQLRFGEAVERLKELLDSGEAGRPGLMTARYFCNSLHSEWWRRRSLSGGQIVEQAIHLFDLMRHWMGGPVTVFSRQANLFHRDVPDYDVEDVSASLFGFSSGAVGVVAATNGAIPGQWVYSSRFVAERLTAEFSDGNHATFVYTAQPGMPSETIDSDRDPYLAETMDLLDAIRGGGKARVPIREGAKSLDLALAALQSAGQGIELRL